MASAISLAIGMAALKFLLLTDAQGTEIRRIRGEEDERAALVSRGEYSSWGGEARLGGQFFPSGRSWQPSFRFNGAAGPLSFGAGAGADIGSRDPGAAGYFSGKTDLWGWLPFLGDPELPRTAARRLEFSRLEIQGQMDRNGALLEAFGAFCHWASALEQQEIYRRRVTFWQAFSQTAEAHPSERGPEDRIRVEGALSTANYRYLLACRNEEYAREKCRLLSGNGSPEPPKPWEWKGLFPPAAPEEQDTALEQTLVALALERDTQRELGDHISQGPGVRFFWEASVRGIASSGTLGWSLERESAFPQEGWNAGWEVLLPLGTDVQSREAGLRRVLLEAKSRAMERRRAELTLGFRLKTQEWEAGQVHLRALESLADRSRTLRAAGTASPEEHERRLEDWEDALLAQGDLHRELNGRMLELRSLSGSLSSWLREGGGL